MEGNVRAEVVDGEDGAGHAGSRADAVEAGHDKEGVGRGFEPEEIDGGASIDPGGSIGDGKTLQGPAAAVAAGFGEAGDAVVKIVGEHAAGIGAPGRPAERSQDATENGAAMV